MRVIGRLPGEIRESADQSDKLSEMDQNQLGVAPVNPIADPTVPSVAKTAVHAKKRVLYSSTVRCQFSILRFHGMRILSMQEAIRHNSGFILLAC